MLRRWTIACGICTTIALLSIACLDRTIATQAHKFSGARDLLRADFLQLPYLQLMALCAAALGAVLLVAHPRYSKITGVALTAGFAGGSAIVLNTFLLKPFFGRSEPWEFAARGAYGFHFFHASARFGSFPSGHSVMLAAFIAVLWSSYPKGRPIYATLIVGLSLALIFGEYHFLSDIVAGLFVGWTVGMIAMHLVAQLALTSPLGMDEVLHPMDKDVLAGFQTFARPQAQGIRANNTEGAIPVRKTA